MRHKYATSGIVLARTHLGEASESITLLTPDLGLVRARAQSLRKMGAKLAAALQTLTESDVTLVRGKEGWRLSGAVLGTEWSRELSTINIRERAGRTASLLLRLVHGESLDPLFYELLIAFFAFLATKPSEEIADAAESLTVLRMLHLLGSDAGELPGGLTANFSPEVLNEVIEHRADYILRINRGIAASGL